MADVYSEGLVPGRTPAPNNEFRQELCEDQGRNSEHSSVLGRMTRINIWPRHTQGGEKAKGFRFSGMLESGQKECWRWGANSLDQQISGPGKKDLFQDLCPAVSSISAKLFPASLRFNSAPEAALR